MILYVYYVFFLMALTGGINIRTSVVKDMGHFPLTKCLYSQYVPKVPGMSNHLWVSQHPYIT